MSRFEILRGEGTLLLRDPIAPTRRLTRIVPLASFLAFPSVMLATRFTASSRWPWIVFVALGLATVLVELVHVFRDRVHDAPPYRPVRQCLRVADALPDTGGLRDAPRRPRLIVDDRPVDVGAALRVTLTHSGEEDARALFHVSVVTRAEIVYVDTFRDRGAAWALGEVLCTALGLHPRPTEGGSEDIRGDWLQVAFPGAVAVTGLVGAAYWEAEANLAGRTGPPLILATLLAGAVFALVRRMAVRRIQARAAVAARSSHGLAPVPSTTARAPLGDLAFATCMGFFVLAVLITSSLLATR
jgi:hypothetical protein